MRTKKQSINRFVQGTVLSCILLIGRSACAQGTITFNGWGGWSGTNYVELGMQFRVVIPLGTSGYDAMGIVPGNFYVNLPTNSTAFMFFLRQNNPYNYVSLRATNNSVFGLTSVQLADPVTPSYTNLPISFIGYRLDGSTVTNTFITPGGGANYFVTYQFSSEFASGLLSVQIDAARWAMDNLRWVPEPRTYALLGLGLLGLAWHRFHKRRKL